MGAQEGDRLLMTAAQVDHTVARMSYAVAELIDTEGGRFALIGIGGGGIPLVERISQRLRKALKEPPMIGVLDITMHRDDLPWLEAQTSVGLTDIPFDVTGLNLILVDDVISSGRTIRAAMDALMDLGRPSKIFLAVLIDRGLRELPIEPRVIGRKVETKVDDLIDVYLGEKEQGEDGVWLKRRPVESSG